MASYFDTRPEIVEFEYTGSFTSSNVVAYSIPSTKKALVLIKRIQARRISGSTSGWVNLWIGTEDSVASNVFSPSGVQVTNTRYARQYDVATFPTSFTTVDEYEAAAVRQNTETFTRSVPSPSVMNGPFSFLMPLDYTTNTQIKIFSNRGQFTSTVGEYKIFFRVILFGA